MQAYDQKINQNFKKFFFFFFPKCKFGIILGDRLTVVRGCIWPTGHSLGTPGLCYENIAVFVARVPNYVTSTCGFSNSDLNVSRILLWHDFKGLIQPLYNFYLFTYSLFNSTSSVFVYNCRVEVTLENSFNRAFACVFQRLLLLTMRAATHEESEDAEHLFLDYDQFNFKINKIINTGAAQATCCQNWQK